MAVGETLRDLGEFLDECEDSGTVTSVELTDDRGSGTGQPLAADIELALPANGRGDGGLSLRETTVGSGGGLSLTFESQSSVLPSTDHEVDIDVRSATIGDDGSILITLSASVTLDDGGAAPREDGGAGGGMGSQPQSPRDSGVPPFRDTDLLEDVYASCETFAEMTDAIGMNVTAETVRRYMIDHGIHDPDSYEDTDGSTTDTTTPGGDLDEVGADPTPSRPTSDPTDGGAEDTASDGDPEQIVLTDGIGLPDDVTVEGLVDTVKRSDTLFEVKQDLGIERQVALEMLQELDMVDLVVGRLDEKSDRDISRGEVLDRLRDASATVTDRPGAQQTPT